MSETPDLFTQPPDGWQLMRSAPHDGSDLWLRVRHANWELAGAHDREKWEQDVHARWIDHNGGGWTWKGLYGSPVGWKPFEASGWFRVCVQENGRWRATDRDWRFRTVAQGDSHMLKIGHLFNGKTMRTVPEEWAGKLIEECE